MPNKRGDGVIIASGPNPDNETYVVKFKPGAGTWTALGIDIFQDESLPGNRVSRGADRFVLTEVEAEVSDGTSAAQKLSFVLANTRGFGAFASGKFVAGGWRFREKEYGCRSSKL